MEDLLDELKRIQQRASALQELLAEAQGSTPPHAEGSDRSGCVRIRLGPDGFPESVRITPDWQRRVPAAQLGRSVLEAAQAASVERAASWAGDFEGNAWRDRLDVLRAKAVGSETIAESPPPPPSRTAPPREFGEVVEEALSLLDSIGPPSASGGGGLAGNGSAAAGKVVVTFTRTALGSCEVEPQWAERQSENQLAAALAAAFSSARTALAQALQDDSAPPDSGPNALIEEVIALLRAPQTGQS